MFILNETKMPVTVHFPKYSPSFFTFPFSVLHSKTSPFVLWTTKCSKTTLPFARSLYKLGPFHLSIFEVAKGCISEIKQPNRTAEDTCPYISLYYVIVKRKKNKKPPHPTEVCQVMKRDLTVLFMIASNTRSSMLVMFIIKALVENQIPDIIIVILEITFNNYNVFFKK